MNQEKQSLLNQLLVREIRKKKDTGFNFSVFKSLITDGADPSKARDKYGQTVLYNACRNGRADAVRLLLADSRIDPSVNDNECIHVACSFGYMHIAALLLEDNRVNPQDPNGTTPLEAAATRGHDDIVSYLLSDSRVDPSSHDNFAIRFSFQHPEVLRVLLEDSRVDPTTGRDGFALQKAVIQNCIESVKVLLRNPRFNQEMVSKAFIEACSNGNLEIVKVLLADPRTDPGYGPGSGPGHDPDKAIKEAASGGHSDIVQILLDDPRVDPTIWNNRPFNWAAMYGHVDTMKILLKDPRVKPNDDDNMAIRFAAEYNRKEAFKFLLYEVPEVDPGAKYNYALSQAIENGYNEIAIMLIDDPRVDISICDPEFAYEDGRRQFIWRINMHCNDEVMHHLLKNPKMTGNAMDRYGGYNSESDNEFEDESESDNEFEGESESEDESEDEFEGESEDESDNEIIDEMLKEVTVSCENKEFADQYPKWKKKNTFTETFLIYHRKSKFFEKAKIPKKLGDGDIVSKIESFLYYK